MDLVKRLRTMAAIGWNKIGDEAADRIEELEARLAILDAFKPSGDAALDAVLGTPDPEFIRMRDSLPPNYWARYDLSAVRIGWHFGRLSHKATEPQGWFFRFNNGEECFVTDPEEAAEIKRHLEPDESCFEWVRI